MRLKFQILVCLLLVTFLSLLSSCDALNGSSNSGPFTATQKNLAIHLLKVIFIEPADGHWSTDDDCLSGTITQMPIFESGTTTYTDCETRGAQILNGTINYNIDIASHVETTTYDIEVTTGTDASIESTMQVQGSSTATSGIDSTSLDYNVTGLIGDETYTVTGSPELQLSQSILGNVIVRVGSRSLTCSFDVLDGSTATAADFEDACEI